MHLLCSDWSNRWLMDMEEIMMNCHMTTVAIFTMGPWGKNIFGISNFSFLYHTLVFHVIVQYLFAGPFTVNNSYICHGKLYKHLIKNNEISYWAVFIVDNDPWLSYYYTLYIFLVPLHTMWHLLISIQWIDTYILYNCPSILVAYFDFFQFLRLGHLRNKIKVGLSLLRAFSHP